MSRHTLEWVPLTSLMTGVVERIVEREMPGVGEAFSPTSAEDLVDAFCVLFEYTTETNRTLTTARHVLFMEASHDEGLREVLTRGRDAMMSTALPALAHLGADDPLAASAAIAACFEGLILHRIARHDEADPRPTFDLVVRAALG